MGTPLKFYHYKEIGTEWHVATWHMQVSDDTKFNMRKWCYETFGAPDHLTYRWKDNTAIQEMRFCSPSDLALFLLKWEGRVDDHA